MYTVGKFFSRTQCIYRIIVNYFKSSNLEGNASAQRISVIFDTSHTIRGHNNSTYYNVGASSISGFTSRQTKSRQISPLSVARKENECHHAY